MVKHIVHIADTHIPNDIKNRPYGEMIDKFLDKLEDDVKGYNNEDLRIVIVGDVFDQKIKATNEAKTMFHNMLNRLNKICKTYIIAGNHDMLQNNRDRMDSINPTFDIEGVYGNITYLDKELGFKSGIYVDDNIVWALYSMHSNFDAPDLLDAREKYPNHTFIGLYHWDIPGATTDIGRSVENGIDVELFKNCDCVMAGHIHKYQEIRKNGVPIVYSGSLFQQNAGENTTMHGYVLWDMEDMEHELVEVDNDYRIFKFTADGYDDVKNDVERLINL